VGLGKFELYMGIRRQFAVARQSSEVGVYGGYHEVYCCAKAVQAVGDHRPKKGFSKFY